MYSYIKYLLEIENQKSHKSYLKTIYKIKTKSSVLEISPFIYFNEFLNVLFIYNQRLVV